MKKILIATLLTLFFASCSDEEGGPIQLDIVPITSVEMPTAFRVDSITNIPIMYDLPTSCHVFSNFYYNAIGNERTVAVYCKKLNNPDCIENYNHNTTVLLSFKPKNIGTYSFRFWSGTNEDGVEQYIEHEIVVDH